MKKEKGITLIALVITIIVLLILAGVSISLVLGDNGILSKAQGATNKYDDAYIKEQLEMAQSAYQIAKKTNSPLTLQEALAQTDLDIANIAGNDSTGYEVKVVTRGEEKTYILKEDGTVGTGSSEWAYDGHGTYTKGVKQLKVGDKVNYNEGEVNQYQFTTDTSKGIGKHSSNDCWTNGVTNPSFVSEIYKTQNLNWRILGVNAEGKIELISETPHPVQVALANSQGYLTGVDELDKLCDALYGKGIGAEKARNLKAEDVNKLSNYDPNTSNTTIKFRKYRFTNDEKYETSDSLDGTTNWSEWTEVPYYMGALSSFTMIGNSEPLISKTKPGETEAIKNTYYSYNIKNSITNAISEEVANLIVYNGGSQMFSSRLTDVGTSVRWEVFTVDSGGNFYGDYLFEAGGSWGVLSKGFRPVVILDENVELEWDSTNNQYNIQL